MTTRPNSNPKIFKDPEQSLPNPQTSGSKFLKAHTQDRADQNPVQNPAPKPHNTYQIAKKALTVSTTTPRPNPPFPCLVSNFQSIKSSNFGSGNGLDWLNKQNKCMKLNTLRTFPST